MNKFTLLICMLGMITLISCSNKNEKEIRVKLVSNNNIVSVLVDNELPCHKIGDTVTVVTIDDRANTNADVVWRLSRLGSVFSTDKNVLDKIIDNKKTNFYYRRAVIEKLDRKKN